MKDMRDTAKGRLLDAIAGLAQDVADQRNAFDRDRRLPDALFAALADAGLFRLWLPVALGGAGLSPPDFQEVVEAAAALDGSVGWLVGNGGGMARAGGYLPASSARAIFADRRAFIVSATGATGRAVPTPTGYLVTGQWPFGSGAHHGTYFAVVCEVDEGGPAGQGQRILAYVPRSAVSVLDTWHVSGLRATGSCDFAMADVEVPSEFTHDFQALPTADGAIYRLPAVSAFCFTVATVPLGIATAARNAFATLAAGHKRSGGPVPLAHREAIQSEVGRVETRTGAARAYLRATMTDLCAEVIDGGPASEGARLRFRTACTLAGETAAAAVAAYCDMAGAAAIFESSPLERYERDVRAAIKHVAMSPAAYATQGVAAFGGDVSSMRF